MRLIVSEQQDINTKKKVASQQLRFRLAHLITISEKMLEFATAENWDQVENLEFTRSKEIREIDKLDYDEQASPEVAQAYETLLEINDQITVLVASGKSLIYRNFSSDKQAVKVAKYYSSNH